MKGAHIQVGGSLSSQHLCEPPLQVVSSVSSECKDNYVARIYAI